MKWMRSAFSPSFDLRQQARRIRPLTDRISAQYVATRRRVAASAHTRRDSVVMRVASPSGRASKASSSLATPGVLKLRNASASARGSKP